jgi:hypothetical protein
MSSPELRESSARMLEVTGGRWPKNVLIPRAAGKDFFTSRMARDLRVFPYGRNIAAVVSVVMNKDRQDAAQKRRVVVRMADPMREAKRAQGSAKVAASSSSKPVPAAKSAAPGPSKASSGVKTAASGGTKPPPGGPAKEVPSPVKLPSPGGRVADFGTNISVEDYLGKFFFWPEICCRVGWGTIGCCPAFGGNHFTIGGGKGEGSRAGPVGRLLRERRDSDSRCR